nr:ribonuclease H-like domain-containing protein [Tanacetum cinerariifolium]
MDQDSAYMVAASKVLMLKPGEYEIWRMRIEQYIWMIDYALWEVIDNDETLLETQVWKLKFNSVKDAKKLLEAVEKRFADLDTMSMNDLYNNLKVYEPEVKGMSSSSLSTQNMAFVSSSNNNTSNTNRIVNNAQVVNIAHEVSTASTRVNAAYSTNINNLSDAVICSFFASQQNSPQLVHVNFEQIHPDDMEEIDLRWQMTILTMRARRECRALRNQDNKNKESSRRSVLVETSTSSALVLCDGLGGYDWSDQAKEGPNYALMVFSSLSSNSEIVDNYKKGLGYENYNAVLPPYIGNFMPLTPDLSFTGLDEFVNKLVVENCKAKSSEEETKVVRKNDDALILKEWVLDNEEEDVSQPKIEKKIVRPSIAKIEFVKSKQQEKTTTKTVKQVEQHRQNTYSPRGNQRNLNNMIVPRKNNMYSIDIKNIVPKGGLTFLFEKATSDESKLWHRRPGHLNFKTMNKLVKGNLVRGLPSKFFENDQTCVAFQKGKQHRASYDLGKFDGKANEGFFVGYSLNSKAFRVFNSRTMIVEENFHISFSENTPNVVGTKASDNADPKSSNDDGSKPSSDDGNKVDEDPRKENECNDQEKEDNVNNTNNVNTVSLTINAASTNKDNELPFDPNMPTLEDVSTFDFLRYDEDDSAVASMNNLDTTIQVNLILTTRIHKDHPLDQLIGDLQSTTKTRNISKNLEEHRFTEVKTTSTPMETQKPLLKDEDGEEVDVHMYRSMIGSLMYLTSSRPEIRFVVCACARYQVNPKVSHLYVVKRIFRASLDKKSTTGGYAKNSVSLMMEKLFEMKLELLLLVES